MNNEQFNLYDNYWYILVNDAAEFNAVVSWCNKNDFKRTNQDPFDKDKDTKAVAHDPSWKKHQVYQASNDTIRDPRSKEIKVEFETVSKVTSVTLPQSINDNASLIKVRELREEINNMYKKLEELEKSFE